MLNRIYRAKAAATAQEMALVPESAVRARAEASVEHRRSLIAAIRSATAPAIVAEIKPASPSAGVLTARPNVPEIARAYERAGAAAISILTERDYFCGELAFLEQARRATKLPLLRKDFLWSAYHVAQSAAFGADALLLIAAGVSDDVLTECLREARRFALDVLVEVHDEEELDRAIAAGARLVGVNNRDLSTLEVDLRTGEPLLGMIPPHVCAMSESGIRTPSDAARMVAAGADALLIGEALMRCEAAGNLIGSMREACASTDRDISA